MGTLIQLSITVLVTIALGMLYFLPAIIAKDRRHHNYVAILILNIFLGWTFLGWVIALVWANTNNVPSRPITTPQKQYKQESGRITPELQRYLDWEQRK